MELVNFINRAPSPFHAVAESKKYLLSKGFIEIKEKAKWALAPKGRYFFTRNQSSIVAFAVGGAYKQGNGFSIVAAHTDSPCLKLKPVSKKESNGYLQVGVQTYGGGLWHTWFDRDLSVAGRVLVKTQEGLEGRLVKIDQPILRIPTLAIHLDRTVSEKLQFNNETHLTPILATTIKNQLNAPTQSQQGTTSHHPVLLSLIAKNLSVEVEQIEDFELCLFDTQPAVVGGLHNEFIFAPRLDNLGMSFCSLKSLGESLDNLNEEENVRMIALFDNEEVGSESAYGAGSNLLESALRRISLTLGNSAMQYEESLQKSFLISADMAHALHPNYSDKHESNHQPKIHGGLVIKVNANQRYATTSVTSSLIKRLASCNRDGSRRESGAIPLQEFVVRNDSPCGSTIGPILSAKLGMRTIDVGNPQLSMHSIREMCGVDDVNHAIRIFSNFFADFPFVDASLTVD